MLNQWVETKLVPSWARPAATGNQLPSQSPTVDAFTSAQGRSSGQAGFLRLVICHTSLISYNIAVQQGPRINLPVTYFHFCNQPFIWRSCQKHGTHYLFTSANPKHNILFFQKSLSSKNIKCNAFRQPIPAPGSPRNVPWFSSETLMIFLNYLLTYL